jgi:hypothetical protein
MIVAPSQPEQSAAGRLEPHSILNLMIVNPGIPSQVSPTEPAGPRPKTRLAGYKRKRAIDQTFPFQ